MLVILAVTGVLRGLQDTTTPLVASVVGFGANIVLNVVFVYGLHWGIAGSAWGTVIAQTGMGLALVTVLLVKARARHARLRPHPARVLAAGRTGIPLLVRTLALRATLLVTTWVAASLGDVTLAAHQVAMTVWSFLAFALDALAIAAQAITGRALGAGDRGRRPARDGHDGALGRVGRAGARARHRRRCTRSCRRSSRPTRPSRRRSARPSSSSGSARRWPATSSSSTASSSARATAGGSPGAWSHVRRLPPAHPRRAVRRTERLPDPRRRRALGRVHRLHGDPRRRCSGGGPGATTGWWSAPAEPPAEPPGQPPLTTPATRSPADASDSAARTWFIATQPGAYPCQAVAAAVEPASTRPSASLRGTW